MRATQRNRRLSGLTLIELMVVLIVIGVTFGAAMPSIGSGLADARVARAARDIIRVFRRARYSSIAHGRAHVVQYERGAGGLGGDEWEFTSWRGIASGCFYNDWETIVADTDYRFEILPGSAYDPDGTDSDSVQVDGFNARRMCYEGGANSQLWLTASGTALWQNATYGSGGIGFSVSRMLDGVPTGVVRKIFVPWGGSAPRLMR